MRNLSKSLTIVDKDRISEVDAEIKRRVPSNSSLSEEEQFKIWERYDQSIRGYLGRYGAVGSRDGVMFYHGGNWFSEWSDGFELQNPTALVILTDPVLGDLQQLVSAHHADARLFFCGDLDVKFRELEVLITSRASFVAWSGSTARQCQAHLKKLGFRVP